MQDANLFGLILFLLRKEMQICKAELFGLGTQWGLVMTRIMQFKEGLERLH